MEQPRHDLRGHVSAEAPNPARRTGILIGVGVLHIGLIWALVVGLASGLIQKLPEELKAEVVKPTEEKKPPPPPPPDLAHPPPPFVPAPEINIAPEAPATTAITAVQAKAPTPAAPPPTQLTAIGRTHTLPPYPDVSIRLGEEGTVTLDVTIDETGTCTSAAVQTSSGSLRLDQAAVDWVKAKWRWNPPTTNGKPSSARTLVKVVFNLKNAH